jgi:integrase
MERRPIRANLPDYLRSWYDNVAAGSPTTADMFYRRLRAFCAQMGAEPKDLVAKSYSEAKLRDLLVRFVTSETRRGRAGSYIRSTLTAVRSWLAHSGRKFELKVNVPGSGFSPRVENERLPTPDQLRSIFLAAKPFERVSCVLMAQAGLRPQAIGNHTGTDGLLLSDVPELVIKGQAVEFQKTPTLIQVRTSNSKAKHRYFTFLGEEGCAYLKEYLEERIQSGEKLTLDSDLLHPRYAEKKFVRALNIGDQVRGVFRRVGFKARPYVLRSYFASRLLEAENAGKVAHDYAEFWLGHRGGVTQKHYTTGRPRLSESMIEDMRAAYKRCEPFLSTVPTGAGQDEAAVKIKRLLLKVAGYTDAELAKVEVGELADDQIEKMVSDRVGRSAELPTQQVVPTAQVTSLLAQGWEVVTSIGPDQVVLRTPNGNGHRLASG